MSLNVDLLKPDGNTIDIQRVVFSMWNEKTNSELICDLSRKLTSFVDEKRVFNEIEFYFPQLAHLIIHLDGSNEAMIELEYLAILLCEKSMHLALQLHCILSAALEDYQPEDHLQMPNPSCNVDRFIRCGRILHNLESTVIYGVPPTLNDKTNKALDGSVMRGLLFFKRNTRKSSLAQKTWKFRHVVIKDGLLSCYRDSNSKQPIRILVLSGATIELVDEKYDYNFVVRAASPAQTFQLRARNDESFQQWIQCLSREARTAPVSKGKASVAASLNGSASFLNSLSLEQIKRFKFYEQQRVFVATLTDICEQLRFLERDVRKIMLARYLEELQLPPLCYLPLCSSLDTFKCVLRVLPKESHAFSTKARCPGLMLFECELHPRGIDTATFLNVELSDLDQNAVFSSSDAMSRFDPSRPVMQLAQLTAGEEDEDVENEDEDVNDRDTNFRLSVREEPSTVADNDELASVGTPLHDSIIESLSKFSSTYSKDYSSCKAQWREEGTGIRRVSEGTDTKSPASSSSSSTETPPLTSAPQPPTQPAGINPNPPPAPTLPLLARPMTNIPTGVALATSPMVLSPGPAAVPVARTVETFEAKCTRLRSVSPYASLGGWTIGGLIAKSNDDVRQEVFVMQLIRYFQLAFKAENVPVWLYSYRILSTTKSTGLIELIPDASSLDGIKKDSGYPGSLRAYFEKKYGINTTALAAAKVAFIHSMAGYSIIAYLLAIKDRHNGNVMLDKDGHIIHIDFGFVFGLAPGKQFSMETAPFKLTVELAEVIGGPGSTEFSEYTRLCVSAFKCARRHADVVSSLLSIMSHESNYPAFRYNRNAIQDFRNRLFLNDSDTELESKVKELVTRSYDHSGTRFYDSFQLATNKIAK